MENESPSKEEMMVYEQLLAKSKELSAKFEVGVNIKPIYFNFEKEHIDKPIMVIFIGEDIFEKRGRKSKGVTFYYQGKLYINGNFVLVDECLNRRKFLMGQPFAITYNGELRSHNGTYKHFNVSLIKEK